MHTQVTNIPFNQHHTSKEYQKQTSLENKNKVFKIFSYQVNPIISYSFFKLNKHITTSPSNKLAGGHIGQITY
jgi:hypothetical protein